MNNVKKAVVLMMMLASPLYGAASDLTFVVIGDLQDGYYGYPNRRSNDTVFVGVSHGVPTIYKPASKDCGMPFNVDTVYFRNTSRGDIWLYNGNRYTKGDPYIRNRPGLSEQGLMAPANKVSIGNHIACNGKIERVKE